MAFVINLPPPECKEGYPINQLEKILGSRINKFYEYMVGQTMSICNGKLYNHNKKEYESTNCGPHGIVVYKSDLLTFLEGRPTLD